MTHVRNEKGPHYRSCNSQKVMMATLAILLAGIGRKNLCQGPELLRGGGTQTRTYLEVDCGVLVMIVLRCPCLQPSTDVQK